LLHFRPPPTPPPVAPANARARAAIIMDDLGRDLETARALLAIDLSVTFAILPGEANAAKVATLAHDGGREVMIHIPMEPQSYPATNPGDDALLLGQSPEEIRRRFQGYVERVPYAVGGNNHMGSRFTEYRDGMEVVLAAMKDTGLFFVDSRTTGQSVAFAEARQAGVPAAARDLFLDNEQDVEQISREIRKLAVLAGRKGRAVGICHPYPQTLEALRREASYLKQQGIEIVPVSQLLVR
ncbi:MAG TPA: divergent polysaccharide deacetylase family protein, partial [Desulfuromonadales bacterium]